MLTYKYAAVSKDGEKVKGVVEAFNELDAMERIKQDCAYITSISEVKETKNIFTMDLDAGHLNTKAFTLMCSQFAIILRAGVPVARACHLVAGKTSDKKLKKMLQQVASDVEAGRGLSESFAERGEQFLPLTFIETIHAGEETGKIDGSFDSMYKHFDKQVEMHNKVRSALSYPIFVLVVAVVVVIILMVKVVPTFIDIFASYDADLPAITVSLIAVSNFFRHYWMVIVVVAAVILLIYKLYGNTENGRMNLAKSGLKLPILGNINTLNAASEFANSMTTMLAAGLPITRSIQITARVLSNYYVSQEVGKIAGKLEEGHSLGESIREVDCLPDILVDMTAVGDESGELEETLGTIAKFYDGELEMAINMAMKKLEPALLLFIAAVAGYIVLAVYIAMFQMYAVM